MLSTFPIPIFSNIPTGSAKTPSTAFCLLVRLFTLRCTEKQMQLMLDHVDSPYIRCIGFLYLRYAVEPSLIFSYMGPYLYDDEPVQIRANPAHPEGTVGEFVRQLLKSMDYYGTLLPRLPVQIERDIKVKLVEAEDVERRAKANMSDRSKMEHFRRVGSAVRALYGDEENPVTWYDAVVDRVLTHDDATGEPLVRPKFIVTFTEYGNTETVRIGEIDLRGQGSSSGGGGARHQGSGSADAYGGGRNDRDRGNDHRGRGRDSYFDDRDRGRGRDRDRYREGDGYNGHRGRGNGGGGRRHEDDRWRRDRYDRDDERGRRYERSRSRSRDRHGGDRERSSPSRHDGPPSGKPSAASAGANGPPPRQEEKRREKTPEELAAIQNKKKKLMSKYG
mmetsp:Transcript_20243/g.58068  ORF Transcript_20243/g.58068 Transcript_20243/m.58068 type:complete len:390 (+) Transcript_20243:480-1649(+)